MMKTFVVYGFLYSVLKPQGFNANLTDKELLLRNSHGFLNSEDSKKIGRDNIQNSKDRTSY